LYLKGSIKNHFKAFNHKIIFTLQSSLIINFVFFSSQSKYVFNFIYHFSSSFSEIFNTSKAKSLSIYVFELLGFILAKYLYFFSSYSKNKYSFEPTTFFQEILLIFSSISPENKSLQILTHFSTEFTKIHSTFFNLSFNGAIFASCTSSQGLIFTSKIKGPSFLSRTISQPIYQIFVTC
jgi:hypothetical protein